MQYVQIPYLQPTGTYNTPLQLLPGLAGMPAHALQHAPWPAHPYKPAVSVTPAHTGELLLLKYMVLEKEIRAAHTQINDAVYEDSCVECFISFGGENAYYNFEFNCTGTMLAGFGNGKQHRNLLPEALLQQVITSTHIVKNNAAYGDHIYWELTAAIPIQVFCHHHLKTWHGLQGRINFYKCGDLLQQPHFISWHPLQWPEPNFHLPDQFGGFMAA